MTARRVRAVILVLAGLLGTASTAYLAIAGRRVGITLVAAHLWFFGDVDTPPAQLAPPALLVRTELALGALAIAWLLAGLAMRHGASARSLTVVGVLWAIPLLLGPPLFSSDAYAYTAIGAAVHHGVDPYSAGPGAAGDIPAVRGSEMFWRYSPTPYSPPFTALLAGLSALFHEHLLQVLVAFRVLCLGAWVSLFPLVRSLARRCGRSPATAVWLAVINPLMLINALSANHNDVLMLALVAAGILLALADRPLQGVLCCVAAAGIKVVALGIVLVIGVDRARRAATTAGRVRALALTGLLGAGAFALSVQLSGYGWGWLRTLSVPGKAIEPLAPLTAVAMTLDAAEPPLASVRRIGIFAGAILCLLLLTRLGRWGLPRVCAWILMVVIAAGPVVWPWYLLWPFTLFAVAGGRKERVLVVVGSVSLLFVTLPGGFPALHLLGRPRADHLVLLCLGLAASAAVVVGLRSLRRPLVAAPRGALLAVADRVGRRRPP